MPCNATSQLTNAPNVPLQVTMPKNNAEWAVFVQRLQDAINATRDAANHTGVNVVPSDFAVYNGSVLPALVITGANAALDTTKHQFGAASLKLTATSATVTVEFSADPIMLQPYSKWIESVFIQSSRISITGTLAIDTPGGSYPVDISGTLIPAAWARLYGDCNLVADDSTTATLVLTLTGCTPGDTFNLEGWQIESASGVTNLPSPFVNTTVPQSYPDTTANASEALANANAAQASANTANAQLAAIASDGTLSPAEKPVVIRDYSVVTNEQAGIDAQAVAFLGASSADQVAYDNAITALTNYLNTLTDPIAWNNKTGNTTVVAATFDATWNAVYEKRQILLNAIYQQAQSLANTAQTTANTGVSNAAVAQTTANTAQTTGTNAQNTANTANTSANSALNQIGNLANSQYLQNPFFSTGDLTGWTSDHGTVYYETGGDGPSSASTSYAVFPHGTAAEALRNIGRLPVYPGAVIKAQCAVRGVGTPNGTCGVRISWRNAADTEISNTQTPNPSTGNATNGTYVTATAPAGAMFAHVECATAGRTDTTGYYTVDNFAAWALADSMDQVPDGVTRFGAVEAGADKTSGKPLSSLSGRTMDYIGDSATRFAAAQAGADKTSSNPQASTWLNDSVNLARGGDSITRFGGRTLDNMGDSASRFAAVEAGADKTAGKSLTVLADRNLGNIDDTPVFLRTVQQAQTETVDNANFEASTALPVPGWIPSGAVLSYSTGFQYEGTQSLQVHATAQFQNVTSARVYKCSLGEVYEVDAACLCGTDSWAFGLRLSDGSLHTVGFTGGWSRQTVRVTIPAGITSFQIIQYKSGTVVPDNSDIDDIHLKRIRVLDDDVMDGLRYGRLANADLYSSGGVNRLGLRIAGSGHTVGDQRNLLPLTWAGVRSVLSISPISYSISGTTVTFTVAAFTLQGGGVNINYAAASGSVTQAAGTTATWFLYFRDATQSGGSLPLAITSNPGGSASFPDSINIGTATVTVNSGGGGTGGTGSGGGGYCVADDTYIGEGRRAGDAEIGDPFDCIDLPTQAGKHVRALQGVSRGIEECVRMITSDGCALVCSVSTPFDLPDGRVTTALHMLGEQVITDLGIAIVTSLALVGPRPVTRAHLGGVSYAAGADATRRIYSHNTGTVKP